MALDLNNAAALGLTPEAYDILKQKAMGGQMLAQNDPSQAAPVTQSDINAQTMSADQAPSADLPSDQAPQPAQNLSMPPEDVSAQAQAQAPDPLAAPDFSGQHQSIAQLKAGLQKYLAQDNQVDLSPLAALADAQTGSHLAQAYTKPTSPEERQLMAQKLQGMIGQAETGLSTEQTKYLIAKTNQENQKDYRQQMLDAKLAAAEATKGAKGDMAQKKAYDDLVYKAETGRGSKVVQQANQNILSTNNALSIINKAPNGDYNQLSNNKVAMLSSEMAKIANGGVASEHTQNTIAAQTLASNWAGFIQKVSNKPTGAQLGEFIKDNKEYLDDLKQNSQNVKNEYVRTLYEGKAPMLNADQRDAFKKIKAFSPAFEDENPSSVSTSSPQLPASTPSNSFPRAIRKGDQTATVNNAQELSEAQGEGWQ